MLTHMLDARQTVARLKAPEALRFIWEDLVQGGAQNGKQSYRIVQMDLSSALD